jgi:hypothetical protein
MGINYDLVNTLGSAKGGTGGEYFKPGHNFKVVIEKCEWKVARDKQEYVIVSTQIIESDCPDQGVGRKPAYMIKMSLDSAQGNLADFLRIALTKLAADSGEDEALDPNDDVYWNEQLSDKALLSAVLEEANVLMGTELYLYTKPITTKANKPFTIHEWSLTPTLAN